MAKNPQQKPIGGILPRLAAFIVDVLAVVGLGMVAGRLLAPSLAPLGGGARLIGYAVFVAYFGLFDHFTATPGKQLLRLVVRRADGSAAPLHMTCLRSAILFLPFLCSGPNPGLAKWNTTLTTVEVAIVYVLGGALPLLWLIGGRSRQSAHDLACQTFVVEAGAAESVSVRPSRRWQGGVMLAWTALILGTMAQLQIAKYTRWPAQDKLQAADQAILQLPDVKGTGYTLMAQVPGGRGQRMLPAMTATMPRVPKILVVSVDVRRKPARPQVLERQVVRMLLRAYPPAAQQASIRVILAYGYDIGIARSYHAVANEERTVAAWSGGVAASDAAAAMAIGAGPRPSGPLHGLELEHDDLGGGLRRSGQDGP